MKTIATAALFLTLTVSAWADEPERAQFELLKHAGEPIVLSEAEMDGVTAGDRVLFNYHHFSNSNAVADVGRTFDAEIGVQLVHSF